MLQRSVFALLLVLLSFPQASTPTRQDDAEVQTTLAAFIQAFDNLEWDHFRSFFADDATVFYPRAIPERAQGRAEFEAAFRKVFEQIRAGRQKPPFMDIQPRGMQIQVAGKAAIVTFHLDDRPGFINRRTLVLVKMGQDWKIVHLHASEVARSQ